ncbi:hypothetical protein [Thiothrix eikelboomii]|uniref:hypothetical protein n=1 Tax=Thiothrix eikelboomii TaxID=92487 RepID=UPI003BAF3684
MRQWVLLGLLSGLVACQSQSIIPPQTLLKSVGYIVYVNGGPPEQWPWAFQSQAEHDTYYAKAANQLKRRSGLLDAELAVHQGNYYFLAVSFEENTSPNKPPIMGQVYADPENFSIEELNSSSKKCPIVKRLEGMYPWELYATYASRLEPSTGNWLVYYNIALDYSRAWNNAMQRACVRKSE